MNPNTGRGLRVHSENRDDRFAERLRARARTLDGLLADLTPAGAEQLAEILGLDEERGPHRLDLPEPTPDAWTLAARLAQDSLAPLAQAVSELGSLTIGQAWKVKAPTDLPDAATLGLPLIAASSPTAMESFLKMRVAARADGFAQVRDNLQLRLAELLPAENLLWDLAAKRGGPTARLPYAFRFRALEWTWDPQRQGGSLNTVTMCLRCGADLAPGKPISSPPRCSSCAKETPGARQWPRHAVAPAERGTWWLMCQTKGCSNAFVGRAQARRCPRHRQSRVTPAQRDSAVDLSDVS